MISDDKTAKLADFGLSGLIEDVLHEFPELAPSDTSTSNQQGNLRWLAPEIARSLADSDVPLRRSRSTDIYSCGMVILEVCTALHCRCFVTDLFRVQTFTDARPFAALREHQLMGALERGERPPEPNHHAYARGFTRRLWNLTRWCWRERPEARPSATDLVSEIEDIMS